MIFNSRVIEIWRIGGTRGRGTRFSQGLGNQMPGDSGQQHSGQ